MRTICKIITLATIALFATSAFAANRVKVSISFRFTVAGRSFPVGDYEVVTDLSRSFITLQNVTNPAYSFKSVLEPGDQALTPVILKFNVIGGSYFLERILTGDGTTPNLIRRNKHAVSTSIDGNSVGVP
jgi:hypothetical protein